MGASVPALARCVGDAQRFLNEHWDRRALLHHGEDRGDLLSLAHVDHILSTMALRLPAFRLVKGGTTLLPAACTRRARIGSREIDDLIDVGKVYREFAGGATIVLQGLHRYWPPVTALCRELEQILTHPVQANAYITPPVSQGLRVHADRHDVFALQTHGHKQWVLYEGEGDEPTLDTTLMPGDCLYVPTGTRHAARTVDTVSVHLTIGIRRVTWAQVLRQALDQALAEVEDAALPAGFAHDPGAVVDAAAERLRHLADRVAAADAKRLVVAEAERVRSARAPALEGQFVELARLDELDDDTEVELRPGALVALRPSGDRLEIVLADRIVRVPARIAPAVRTLVDRQRLRVGELAPDLDADGRLVFVRRMVREGLLTTALSEGVSSS